MVAETSYTGGMARRHLARVARGAAVAGLALGLLAGPVLAADYEWTRSVAAGVTNSDWMRARGGR